MLRRILIIGGACLGVALMVNPAVGQRNPPKKANKYQATVVQGVEECTAPNTTAPGVTGTAACDPVVPADSGCVFTEKGGGKVAASAKDDIKIQVGLKGIDLSCDGETLCAVSSFRASHDNCASTGDCSSITQPDFPLGFSCCTVEKGKCKVKTTINTALPGALVTGNRAEFTIGEVGMNRSGGGVAFRAGLLLP